MTRILAVIFSVLIVYGVFAQDTTQVRLLFAGDIMQHDSQIKAAFIPDSNRYSYSECFSYIKPVVENANLAIANLELTLGGAPFKGYPQFSAPDELARDLYLAGFDVLTTANNHSLDRRKSGLERTIRVLDSLEIAHTGTFVDSIERARNYPLKLQTGGINFSLLNYTYGTNGIPVSLPNIVNLLDTISIKEDIKKAKAQDPDFIIAFVHWGAEYQSAPNQYQKNLSELFKREGVQIVIGSHPHVLQPMSWDKDDDFLVIYSLGNFVSGQQSRYRDGGAMVWIDFEKVVGPDSVKSVEIKNASYELIWVYRNEETPKKYFVLPIKEFESDTLILPVLAKKRMQLFVNDSRKLLAGNNHVAETDREIIETTYFKIILGILPESSKPDSTSVLNFYGLTPEYHGSGLTEWSTKKIYDIEVAKQALNEIQNNTEFRDAQLALYYWGKRMMLLPRKDHPD